MHEEEKSELKMGLNLSSDEDDDGEDQFLSGMLDKTADVCSTQGTTATTAFGRTDGNAEDEHEYEYDDYYDFDDDDNDDRKPSSMDASSYAAMAFPSDFDTPLKTNDEMDEDEDDDDINWEDGEEDNHDNDNNSANVTATTTTTAPKAVTLEMGGEETTTTTSKTKPPPSKGKRNRSVSVFRHDKLDGNPELQKILTELHKTSLLAWVCHSNCLSRYASKDLCLGLAHSLIPTAWLWGNNANENENHKTKSDAATAAATKKSSVSSSSVVVPTTDDIGHFLRWFVDYVGPLPSSSSQASSSNHASTTRTGKRLAGTRNRSASAKNKNKKTDKKNSAETMTNNRNNTNASSVAVAAKHRLSEYCRHLAKRNETRRNNGGVGADVAVAAATMGGGTRTSRRTRAGSVRRQQQQQQGRDAGSCSFSDYDALLLFLSMVRSLGWRARYVVAVEPISRDLDVDHPLFHQDEANQNKNVLLRFFDRVRRTTTINGKKDTPISLVGSDGDDSGNANDNDTNKSKSNCNDSKQQPPPTDATAAEKQSNKKTLPLKKSYREHQRFPTSLYNNKNKNDVDSLAAVSKHFCWVEILCKHAHPQTQIRARITTTICTTTKNNSNSRLAASQKPTSSSIMQWIHVDPVLGITNQPSMVEEALLVKDRLGSGNNNGLGTSRKKNNRLPISYALAVEHLSFAPGKKVRTSTASDYDGDNQDLCVRMTDVTRRYASSMVDTMEARGIVQKRRAGKPKRRKLAQAIRGDGNRNSKRAPPALIIEEEKQERPDLWFLKLLKTMSSTTRNKSCSKHNRKNAPASSKTVPQELKSEGKTEQDDIALDDNGDESDSNSSNNNKKPAAASSRIKRAGSSDGNCENEDEYDHDGFDVDRQEESQLRESAKKEPLPTSKAAFKKHPIYVVRSVLNSTEVLKPDAKKRVCGMFKGELVYLRADVETALSAKRWLYEGRKVRESESKIPILKTKARKKPASSGFKALKSYGVGDTNDGSEEFRATQIREASEPLGDDKQYLYGSWQTDSWGPTPVGPNDPIPVNDYNNVELELLNPGLVHVELHHIAKVSKRLNLPYAPCLLGFEGNRGNRTPTIRGIVIHKHNEELLREAHAGMADYLMKEEQDKRQRAILLRWKRLLTGVLTKDRIEREYGKEDGDN